jgi:hypothetical protein
MTTRVTVFNHGVHPIAVEVLEVALDRDHTEPSVKSERNVIPGVSQDFYIFDTQDLRIKEVK